jgi:hypothetical protein
LFVVGEEGDAPEIGWDVNNVKVSSRVLFVVVVVVLDFLKLGVDRKRQRITHLHERCRPYWEMVVNGDEMHKLAKIKPVAGLWCVCVVVVVVVVVVARSTPHRQHINSTSQRLHSTNQSHSQRRRVDSTTANRRSPLNSAAVLTRIAIVR